MRLEQLLQHNTNLCFSFLSQFFFPGLFPISSSVCSQRHFTAWSLQTSGWPISSTLWWSFWWTWSISSASTSSSCSGVTARACCPLKVRYRGSGQTLMDNFELYALSTFVFKEKLTGSSFLTYCYLKIWVNVGFHFFPFTGHCYILYTHLYTNNSYSVLQILQASHIF